VVSPAACKLAQVIGWDGEPWGGRPHLGDPGGADPGYMLELAGAVPMLWESTARTTTSRPGLR
jgi:hypothetical protein